MGRPILIGDTSIREIRREPEYDPTLGPSLVRVFAGSEEACGLYAGLLAPYGATQAYQVDGPNWECRVRMGSLDLGDIGDIANDQWELDTEFVQEDFWMSPRVLSLFASDSVHSNYKKVIEKAIDDRLTVDEAVSLWSETFGSTLLNGDPFFELFHLRNRGDQATEVERKILRRVRTLMLNSTLRTRLDAVPYVYTTHALIAAFAIPSDIAALLPGDPATTPNFTAWAWKKRQDRLQVVPAVGRVQEVTDFVFAAWGTLQYLLVV